MICFLFFSPDEQVRRERAGQQLPVLTLQKLLYAALVVFGIVLAF